MNRHNWISLHLFYHDPLDRLLLRYVRPLVADLRAARQLDGAFFVRYWQAGPHVRLRLQPAAGCDAAAMTAFVVERATAFFGTHPSTTMLDAAHYKEETDRYVQIEIGSLHEPLVPNNTLRLIPYDPEVKRYGGLAALPIIERYFDASSTIVLEWLAATAAPTAPARASEALLHMLLAITATQQAEAAPDRLAHVGTNMWSRALNGQAISAITRFEQHYQQQREQIQAMIAHVLRLVRQINARPGEQRLHRWVSASASLASELHCLAERGELLNRPDFLTADEHIDLIIASCLHMHNNRIGLALDDEVGLWHLIRQALRERFPHQSSPQPARAPQGVSR